MIPADRNVLSRPLRVFFGKQRGIGRYNENPSVKQYLDNCNALRLMNILCIEDRNTNVRQVLGGEFSPSLSKPLPRR